MELIKIGLVDDHKIVRDGIKLVLMAYPFLQVCLDAADAETFYDKLWSSDIQLAIVDYNLPGMSGLELTTKIKQNYPKIEVLVLSSNVDEKSVMSAINAGARGYVSKDAGAEELIDAICSTVQGEEYYGGKISKVLYKSYSHITKQNNSSNINEILSQRELEILKLFADGLSYKEIANKLCLSVRTVESHKNHIMEKLGLVTLADLIKFAIKNNLVQL